MANVVNFQTLEDGQENTVIRLTLNLDTSDVTSTTLADPATLSDIGPFAGRKATQLRVKKVVFDVEDSLAIRLFWDATTPVQCENLIGRGTSDYRDFGGLQNNSGAGKTGKITFDTQGWAAAAQLQATVTIYLGKQV